MILPGEPGAGPAPKYATPLTAGRPNLLPQAEALAALIGLSPLLPWQKQLLALITEYEEGNPEDGIVPYYRSVTFSVPRQTGKTEVICTCVTCLRFIGLYAGDEPPHMVYAAQTQADAVGVWETKLASRLINCEWGKEVGFFWTSQTTDPHLRIAESYTRKGNRFRNGKVRIIANKSGSGLGMTSDMVFLDEARQYGDESREADLVPQMNTRPSPQLIVSSTMGGPASPYFNRKVDAGRVLAEEQTSGRAQGIRRAYVEYGVGDKGSDEYDAADRNVWKEAHPMLGFCNWSEERMADEYDRCLAEGNLEMFRNNFLNQRLRADDKPAIPLDLITAAETERLSAEELGDYQVLALSSSPEGRFLAAAVCGNSKVRVVRPGYDDQVGDLVRTEKHMANEWLDGFLTERPYIRQVRFAADSEMSAMIERYRKPGVWVAPVPMADYRTMCVGLLAGLTNGVVGLEASGFFLNAVAAAERYEGAMGRNWLWRKKPEADTLIDELVAVTLAFGGWSAKASRPVIAIYGTKERKTDDG